MKEWRAMNPKKDDPFIKLREKAENILKGRGVEGADPDFAGLVHELEVHHLELELQNDELRRTQKEMEASRNDQGFLSRSVFSFLGLPSSNKVQMKMENVLSSSSFHVEKKLVA
jgi:hypothetical protein